MIKLLPFHAKLKSLYGQKPLLSHIRRYRRSRRPLVPDMVLIVDREIARDGLSPVGGQSLLDQELWRVFQPQGLYLFKFRLDLSLLDSLE